VKRIAFLLLVAISPFVHAAPRAILGDERATALTDTGPAVLGQWQQVAACDGDDCLVLWSDDRFRTAMASRIAADGTPIDAPFALTIGGSPTIHWTGSDYVVVSGAYDGTRLLHLSRTGEQREPSVLLDPGYHEVIIAESRVLLASVDGRYVKVQAFDFGGRAIASRRFELPSFAFQWAFGVDEHDRFAAAFTIFDNERSGTYAMTFSGDLAPSALSQLSSQTPGTLALAGKEGRFTLVTWNDGALWLQQMGSDAVPLAAPMRSIDSRWFPNFGDPVTGDGFLLLPLQNMASPLQSPSILRVGLSDLRAELIPVTSGRGSMPPAIAMSGSGLLLAWLEDGGVVVDAAPMDAHRDVAKSAHQLVFSASLQRSAQGSAAGDTTLLVWTEQRDDFIESVWCGRIDIDGGMLDGRGLRLSTPLVRALTPRVVFDGATWVVVWHELPEGEAPRLRGMRVGRDGRAIDATPFVVGAADADDQTQIATDVQGTTLVVRRASIDGAKQLLATRLRGGAVAGDAIVVSTGPHEPSQPAVAFRSGQFVLAWAALHRNPVPCTVPLHCRPYLRSDLVAATVEADGMVRRAVLREAATDDIFFGGAQLASTSRAIVMLSRMDTYATDVTQIAELDSDLRIVRSRDTALSELATIGVIDDVPVTAYVDDVLSTPSHLSLATIREDLSVSDASSTPVTGLWDWSVALSSGANHGWLLYDRRTIASGTDAIYQGAPRVFARRVMLQETRRRAAGR
jgi:hypothetical protein